MTTSEKIYEYDDNEGDRVTAEARAREQVAAADARAIEALAALAEAHRAELAQHVPCPACAWSKPRAPEQHEEPPLVRGALDAQAEAEARAREAERERDDWRDRAEARDKSGWEAGREEGRREVASWVLHLCARIHLGHAGIEVVQAILGVVEPLTDNASLPPAPSPKSTEPADPKRCESKSDGERCLYNRGHQGDHMMLDGTTWAPEAASMGGTPGENEARAREAGRAEGYAAGVAALGRQLDAAREAGREEGRREGWESAAEFFDKRAAAWPEGDRWDGGPLHGASKYNVDTYAARRLREAAPAPKGGTPEPKGVPHAMTPSWWPTTVDRIECDDCGLPFEPYDQVRAVAWSHVVCPDGPRPEGLETAPESPAAPSEPAGCTCAGDGVPFHHGSCPEAAPKSTEPAASEDDDEPDDAVLCDGCSKARPVERVAFGEDAITCDECSAKMAAEAASMGGTPEPTCAHPEGDRECGATLPCGRHPWENADQPEPPAAPTEPEPDSPKPAPAQPKRYVTGAELERVHDAAEALREAASSYAEAVELGDPQNTEDAKWLASADEHLLTCARTWVASLPAAAAPQGAGPVLAPEKRYALRDRSLEANDRIDALSPSEVR